MKINRILLFGLLLAVLTISAVSASDTNITSEDFSSVPDGETVLSDLDDKEADDTDDEEEDEGDDEEFEEFFIDWEAEENIYHLNNDAVIAALILPEDAEGCLEVYEDADLIGSFPLTKGHAEVTLGDLNFQNKLGKHYLMISYSEWDYYVESIDGDINVIDYEFKKPIKSVMGQDTTYVIDFHKKISGILKVGDEITDGHDLTETTYRYFNIADGICRITLSDLKLGKHLFTFDSDDCNFHESDEFWVYPPINVKNQVIIGQDSFFTLNLASNASGEIMFTIFNEDDGTEDELTVYYEDGKLEINSAGLMKGHYDIIAFSMTDNEWGKFDWEESPEYENQANYFSFDAVYPVNALIVADNAVSTYTDGKVYKVKVMIGTKAIEGANVVFKINGKTVKTATTDENGFATFKISKVPGSYKLSITALGNTVTKNLKVKDILKLSKVSVKKSAKKLTLVASLAKVNGKYLKKKTVTFKFNGKKYKKTTNSKGVAKITIPKSAFAKLKIGKKITYQATYLKNTVKRTVKVSK